MGQFRSPGAEQYFLRKKNMDRSIDLAVQHICLILTHLFIDETPDASFTKNQFNRCCYIIKRPLTIKRVTFLEIYEELGNFVCKKIKTEQTLSVKLFFII